MTNFLRENKSVWDYIKTSGRPVVIYGMGNGADKLIAKLDNIGVKVSAVFASDDFVRGQVFRGFTVCKFFDIKNIYNNPIILLAFATFRPDVLYNIRNIAAQAELLAPELPVFGDDIFDVDFLKKHSADLKHVYENLADDKSQQIMLNLIDYKISGKINYLTENLSQKQEIYRDILNIGEDEVFFDAGAYTGDTIDEFITASNKKYHMIYGVEPNRRNFTKLQNSTAAHDNINIYNCALWEKDGSGYLTNTSGRQSFLQFVTNDLAFKPQIQQEQKIQLRSVDSILDGKNTTIIKYDVEGCEEKAIAGSANTIREHTPNLIISAYHRSTDIFQIPKLVFSINNNYNLYIRRPEYIPPWDTVFIFKQKEQNNDSRNFMCRD